jgi:hypothetical protein
MKLCHSVKATSSRFDDPNLIGAAGLVPVMALAERAGLCELANEWIHVPTDYPECLVIPRAAGCRV